MSTFAFIIFLFTVNGYPGGVANTVTEVTFYTKKSCELARPVIAATKPKTSEPVVLTVSGCFKK